MSVPSAVAFTNLANTDTLIKTGPGVFHGIQAVDTTAYKINVYDGLNASGTLMFAFIAAANIPDVSLQDTNTLAQAANSMANALQQLNTITTTSSPEFADLARRLILKFAGQKT
jgi:hypothetical protein